MVFPSPKADAALLSISAERAALRRAYKTQWQRKTRQARKRAGMCVDCGAACAVIPKLKHFCEECAGKIQAREAGKRAAERVRKEAERQAARNAPGAPFCPHCAGRDLRRAGGIRERRSGERRQRYRCRACGRLSYGRCLPTKVMPDYPCPACGKRCWKSGRSANGSQRFICTECGRKNTNLWPQPERSPGGPFRRVRTFYLGPWASLRLRDYCDATGQSVAQAVRALFRQAARPVFASARREYGGKVGVRSGRLGMGRAIAPNVRLPDLRRQVTRERMRRCGKQKHLPTVYVCLKISVALDDLAWAGLVATMARTGKTHQEAARLLVEQAKLPGELTVAVGKRVGE